MSAAVDTYRDEMEATYAVDFSRDREPIQSRKRFPEYRRTGGAPTRVSGMHTRRNKRWTWGSGRGAKMQNLRAFAGALALVMASVASNAFAVTLDLVTIGNPNNAPNLSSSPAGRGAVASTFQMSRTETTNTMYVEFLNSVGASNPNSIYSASMASDANGGILQSGSSGSFTYSLKSPAFASSPVNFVNWFDAARFVNWLENGQTSNVASLETGSYTLGGATSGPIAARNPGATYFLPSDDEWYKAAFYNASSSDYDLYATGTDSAPTASLPTAAPNNGNFANVTTGPVAVMSYPGTTSSYGLFDMLGNVGEFTDSGTGNNYYAVGGGYAATATMWNATAARISRGTGLENVSHGFRVAAVPEPGTIAMAGAGLAGLAGLEWKRRRNAKVWPALV